MFCPKCGSKNSDEVQTCHSCNFNIVSRKKKPEVIEPEPETGVVVDKLEKNIVIQESKVDSVINDSKEEILKTNSNQKGDLVIRTNVDCTISINGKKENTKDMYLFLNDISYGKNQLIAETETHEGSKDVIIDKQLTKENINLQSKIVNLYAKSTIGDFKLTLAKKSYKKTYNCPELIGDLPAGLYQLKIEFKDKTFLDKFDLTGKKDFVYELTENLLKEKILENEIKTFSNITSMPMETLSECQEKTKVLVDFEQANMLFCKEYSEKYNEELDKVQSTLSMLKKREKEIEKKKNLGLEAEFMSIIKLSQSTPESIKIKTDKLKVFAKKDIGKLSDKTSELLIQLKQSKKDLKKKARYEKKIRIKKFLKKLAIYSGIIILIVVIGGYFYLDNKKKNEIKNDDLLFEKALNENSVILLKEYINAYGIKGRHYKEAETKLNNIYETEKRIKEENILKQKKEKEFKEYLREAKVNYEKHNFKTAIEYIDLAEEIKKNHQTKELRKSINKKKDEMTKLRSNFIEISIEEVKSDIIKKNLRDYLWNSNGEYNNEFELKTIGYDNVIIDNTSGLMWHQSGSLKYMTWSEAKEWIKKFNSSNYAYYNDWRLPTIEEAASLIENSINDDKLYISGLFSKEQESIWTGDIRDSAEYNNAWYVTFYSDAGIGSSSGMQGCFVRPVRTINKD